MGNEFGWKLGCQNGPGVNRHTNDLDPSRTRTKKEYHPNLT